MEIHLSARGSAMRQRTWRDGWVRFPIGDARDVRFLEPKRTERAHPSESAYQHDAAVPARDGWQVVAVVDRVPRGVIARGVARCRCRLRGRPAPPVVVKYKRLH
jgi:hypothetical protein